MDLEMLEAFTESSKRKVLQHTFHFEAIVDELANFHEPIVVCRRYAVAGPTVFVCELKRVSVGVIRKSAEGLRGVVQLTGFDESRYSHQVLLMNDQKQQFVAVVTPNNGPRFVQNFSTF